MNTQNSNGYLDFRKIQYCGHPTWVPAGWINTEVGTIVGVVMCTDCCVTANRADVVAWIQRSAVSAERV